MKRYYSNKLVHYEQNFDIQHCINPSQFDLDVKLSL